MEPFKFAVDSLLRGERKLTGGMSCILAEQQYLLPKARGQHSRLSCAGLAEKGAVETATLTCKIP